MVKFEWELVVWHKNKGLRASAKPQTTNHALTTFAKGTKPDAPLHHA